MISVNWTEGEININARQTPDYQFQLTKNIPKDENGRMAINALFWELMPLSIGEMCSRINENTKAINRNWEVVSEQEMTRWLALYMLSMEYVHCPKRELWQKSNERFFPHPYFGR
jgi:hypothetical protein